MVLKCICLWEESARNAWGGGEGKGVGGQRARPLHRALGRQGGGYLEPPSQAVFCVQVGLTCYMSFSFMEMRSGHSDGGSAGPEMSESSGLCLRAALRGPRGMITPLGMPLAIQFWGTYKSFLHPIKSSPSLQLIHSYSKHLPHSYKSLSPKNSFSQESTKNLVI